MINRILRVFLKGFLPIGVIGGTAWAVRSLYLTSPTAERQKGSLPVPVVSVVEVEPSDQEVMIQAYGTIIPARRVTLQAQVSGRIIHHHPALVPGGVLMSGSEVIRIDPTDYELRVKQAEVALESANASFELERGQRVVAVKEWDLLKDEIEASEAMEDFALRKPQQRRAQAEVEGAKNQLALARLDLERTVLRAPFNALVLDESVELGQLISPPTEMADLVGTDRFWLRVSVPLELLDRVRFAEDHADEGSLAKVFVNPDDENSHPRPARVLRLLGDLSDRGRMARVLVSIDDPFNLTAEADANVRPVLLDSYVRVAIHGGTLRNVVEVPRLGLRENRRVWVRDTDGLLRIRDVNIKWRQRDSVLVANQFVPGDQLIVSRLAVVIPGMPVRVGVLPGSKTTSPASGLGEATPAE